LAKLAEVDHVAEAENPYSSAGAVSPDRTTAVAKLRLDVTNPDDMPQADTRKLLALAEDASGAQPELKVTLGGLAVQRAEQGEIGSEGIGLIAAAVILLLMFGSVVAAGLPILVAVAGLAVGTTLAGVLAALLPVPDWSTSLVAMMGIGIGIDYALLMVTRFREWRRSGLDPERATVATLDTAGRSVLLAGSTVVVSMLGLFMMGVSFMRGAALVTIVGVLVVMAAAVTLFPALLGYFGRHIERLHIPVPGFLRGPAVSTVDGPPGPGRGWLRWSQFVERHRVLSTLGGFLVLLVFAAPFLGIRFGFPDPGNDPAGTSTRQAYDLQTRAFGKGSAGPLLLVVQFSPADAAELPTLVHDLGGVAGVAGVQPPQLNSARDTAVIAVIPKTGPQDAKTVDLVHRLREDFLPGETQGTGFSVHVGGVTATTIDSTANVVSRLPLLVGGVVTLSMLLLLLSFRSVAIAIKAAVMNLLSVASAYGVVAYVLQGGWAGRLLGIDTPTPLPAFIPVLMFAVLFGLSMDYEVFLVSRMRETWVRTGDNAQAIVSGLASTARVITAAAAIMIAVFLAFVPSPEIFLKLIGVGMAAAILIDATVIRMLLVPAVMHLMGQFNWWLPGWLDRALPELQVEGRPEVYLPVPAQAQPERVLASG
jgi:RND superfamily putative drug exporter